MSRPRRPRPSPRGPTRRRGTVLASAAVGLALLGASFALYRPILDAPFVYDDGRTVVDNPTLADPGNLAALLLWDRFRPLANLSFALDASAGGRASRAFHRTAVLLHALAAFLLFAVARRAAADAAGDDARGEGGFALAVASLFAVHPLATQAVAYVSARAELLATVLVLGTLVLARAAIVSGRRGWAAAAAGLGVLAVAAKETGAVAAPLVVVYDLLLLRDRGQAGRRLRLVHAPLLVVLAVAGVLRLVAHRLVEGVAPPRPLGIHWLSEAEVTWRYLGLLVWPRSLSLVQPAQRASGPADAGAWLAVAGLVGLAALAVALRRRLPLVTLGLAWVALGLAPSAVVPLNELMAEHRAYLASGGFALAAATLVRSALRASPLGLRGRRRVAVAATLATVVALVTATARRLEVWRDPVALWRDAAAKAPLTWAPHAFLAQELRDRGDLGGAIAAYRRAAELQPDHLPTRVNFGIALAMAGRRAEAEIEFGAVLARDPSSVQALGNLGRLLALEGRYAQARAAYERALGIEPGSRFTRLALAELLREVYGDLEGSRALCQPLVDAHPDDTEARRCVTAAGPGG